MKSPRIKRASLTEIARMNERGQLSRTSETNDEVQSLPADFWAKATLVSRPAPKSVHLKLDPEVFDFFKRQGKGHLTKMQDVLRSYMLAHRQS